MFTLLETGCGQSIFFGGARMNHLIFSSIIFVDDVRKGEARQDCFRDENDTRPGC